jgi:hypothetical protein
MYWCDAGNHTVKNARRDTIPVLVRQVTYRDAETNDVLGTGFETVKEEVCCNEHPPVPAKVVQMPKTVYEFRKARPVETDAVEDNSTDDDQ